ncbi:hypothetical protein CBM2592_A190019 [Cupriavidus taiwanensis]|nr:hypothetical protein CBM2592_A190019 [Cupriavidus taiwanensis]SOY83043.1 hypothetical protein CBM2591_A230021 [Cupriavidus taiwanensis]SOZ78812.1 hypothetical protein CBM2618_A180027 [Cupriavidus taiwanensis]SOZ79086.1 hypothetical protein CBM2622_A170026 [Cupriavidus taiwanensis]SPA13844.1 hypothetical protein CBM2631_A210021 [Cupriavidus taiwanensis]
MLITARTYSTTRSVAAKGKAVVDAMRGAHLVLENIFDEAYKVKSYI